MSCSCVPVTLLIFLIAFATNPLAADLNPRHLHKSVSAEHAKRMIAPAQRDLSRDQNEREAKLSSAWKSFTRTTAQLVKEVEQDMQRQDPRKFREYQAEKRRAENLQENEFPKAVAAASRRFHDSLTKALSN